MPSSFPALGKQGYSDPSGTSPASLRQLGAFVASFAKNKTPQEAQAAFYLPLILLFPSNYSM